jgi:protein CpxP
MKSVFKPLLVTALLATSALMVQAQTPTMNAQSQGHGMGHHERMDPAKMHERMAARQAELKAKLNLNAAQEDAWNDYVATMQPPANKMGKHMNREDGKKMREQWKAMTTPERLDRMAAMKTERDAMRAQHDAHMTTRIQATRNFYDLLAADQQKVFDANTMMGGHDGGHQGKGGHHRG